MSDALVCCQSCGDPIPTAAVETEHCLRCQQIGNHLASNSTSDSSLPDWLTPTEMPASTNAGNTHCLGRFQIRHPIESGEFGTVYLAYDPHLDREVALKVPHPGTLADAERVKRFLREARAAGNLNHPNIVALFETGRDKGTYFIASAYIPGTSLEKSIPSEGMDLRDAAEIVRKLARALSHAHEQGIIHRDVKPANVMMDSAGRPHLVDFGLASCSDDTEKLTIDGTVLGTPEYMAPEQALGQRGDPQPASDQYSLGVLFYKLLTGRTPFQGTLEAVLAQVIEGKIVPPGHHRAGLPWDLETICLKALSRLPDDRYIDCNLLANDLRRWLDGLPIRARRLSPWEIAWRWIKNSLLIVSTVAISVLLLAVSLPLATYYHGLAHEAQQRQVREQERREQAEITAQEESNRADEAIRRTSEADAQSARDEARARVAEQAIQAADAERARLEALP